MRIFSFGSWPSEPGRAVKRFLEQCRPSSFCREDSWEEEAVDREGRGGPAETPVVEAEEFMDKGVEREEGKDRDEDALLGGALRLAEAEGSREELERD